MNWRDVYSPADLGYEPDDAPDGRCHGPAYDGAHGCGRFVAVGVARCERCGAESDAHWHEVDAQQRQWEAEMAQRMSSETHSLAELAQIDDGYSE